MVSGLFMIIEREESFLNVALVVRSDRPHPPKSFLQHVLTPRCRGSLNPDFPT